MKEITFNQKVYNVPENWSEVTIGMLMRVSEYEVLLDDAPIISIIAGYTGIDVTELKTSVVKEVQDIMETLEFIYVPYVARATNRFTFEGSEYIANESLEDVQFQDWVSVQTILYQHKDNQVNGLHKLIAIICKKDGETLDDFNVEERATMFLGLPSTTAQNIQSFFLYRQIAYNSLTLLFSTIPEQEKLVLHKFNELGDLMNKRQREFGIFSPTKYVIGIYRLYLKYLKKELEAYFNSQHSELSKKSWIATYKRSVTEKFGIKVK